LFIRIYKTSIFCTCKISNTADY